MYIAMNRFKVAPEQAKAFEDVWATRQSYLAEVPGFVEFHMLRGADCGDHVLYASHTVWSDRDAFDAWTHSEAFRLSHQRANTSGPRLTLGHPVFEGYEVFQHIAA
ncbi:antibiotic biosynthesis monooxygenase [Aurantimonas sp. VKM B-3413]|uniref:antibiotic biosynthesis monooxygenase family protein n=1 Tax=Aurantimonas sp. VKM B-3413 TaxID=2779401 RepID=UPI001E5A4BAE|nr:antibiotic biosynthesis monooxygenase [Aurantimonas sp. VKM B-3413]MCB8836713.1 antibiotic biosynthesis monooxygenase [Aurantimonas sp. VKM B-3413]